MLFVTGCEAEPAKGSLRPATVEVTDEKPVKTNRLTVEGQVTLEGWNYAHVVHDSKTGRDFLTVHNNGTEIRVIEIHPKEVDHGERGIQQSGREHP